MNAKELKDFPYADLLDHKYLGSKGHSHLSITDRAAQFMPFDALTGFDEAIAATEQATLKENISELGDVELERLSDRLREIEANGLPSPAHTLTYLIGDDTHTEIVSVEATIRRIDPIERKLYLSDGRMISFERLRAVD